MDTQTVLPPPPEGIEFHIYHFEITSDKRIKSLKGKDLPPYTFMLPVYYPNGSHNSLWVYESRAHGSTAHIINDHIDSIDEDKDHKQPIIIPEITPRVPLEDMLTAMMVLRRDTHYNTHFLKKSSNGKEIIDIYVSKDELGFTQFLKDKGYTVFEFRDHS